MEVLDLVPLYGVDSFGNIFFLPTINFSLNELTRGDSPHFWCKVCGAHLLNLKGVESFQAQKNSKKV
jgi:hypothetical protein